MSIIELKSLRNLQNTMIWTRRFNERNSEFPVLYMGRDSYINEATIETSIMYSLDDGKYNLQIGNHSSVGRNVKFIINSDHDYLSVHLNPISGIGLAYRKMKVKGQIIIENDCWIADGVTILGGVTIHNGAVVAAGAVVTKDVPPYALIGGNPAKIIKYRFDEQTIKKMLKIQWWYWDYERLIENKEYMNGDIYSFANKFYDAECENGNKKTYALNRMTEGKCYLFCVDYEYPYPIYEKVICEFAKIFHNSDAELLLYICKNTQQYEESCKAVLALLERLEKYNIYVNIVSEDYATDLLLIEYADYYITNRESENIKRMNCAEQLNVKCIAGVNKPIFNLDLV